GLARRVECAADRIEDAIEVAIEVRDEVTSLLEHAVGLRVRDGLVDDVHVAGLAERIEGPLAAHRDAGAGMRTRVSGAATERVDLAELLAGAAVRDECGHDDVL